MKKGKIETKDIKELDEKLKELKMDLLKQVQKRKQIKKEIARILTSKNQTKPIVKEKK